MATYSISARLAPAILLGVLAVSTVPLTAQALPPERVNYQGVLRDQNNLPLSGTFDMWFRFFDAASAGNEILVDQHAAATGNAITVSGGLLDVVLGTGTVTDGSGPGTYTLLSTVFGLSTDVWLEIQVGAETLSPRTQIQSVPYALNARRLGGHSPGYFLDTSSSFQAKNGQLQVYSPTGSSFTALSDQTAITALGDDVGIHAAAYGMAYDNAIGGDFWAEGDGSMAIRARGETGAQVLNGDATVHVELASRFNHGVDTYGGQFGGLFQTSVPGSIGIKTIADQQGGSFNSTGASGLGLFAQGSIGGIFKNAASSASANLANSTSGGLFQYSPAGTSASLATDSVGITASGPQTGGYFSNGAPYFSYAYLPVTDRGIWAHGSGAGGAFDNSTTGAWALVSYSSYKIFGSGAVSFVQNHPEDASKAIVYAAPEGDEVAVYTRGSGRLVNGIARIKLGETFALVANPDIGLTATATARGKAIPLGISSIGTRELVVSGPTGSDAEFDYMVWGLRIGFEEQSIVQPKQADSKIPSMHQHAKYFEDDPSLRRYTALARFEGVEEAVHGRKPTDFSQANALRNAIGVNPRDNAPAFEPARPRGEPPSSQDSEAAGASGAPSHQPARVESVGDSLPADRAGTEAQPLAPAGLDLFISTGAIDTGDVVSLAAGSPGAIVRSDGPADALVIGCAQAAGTGLGQVAVATSRIALCRVSAAWGPVAVGDRLSPSPVAGTAMKSDEVAGAVVLGRAIEPLDAGTGLVRVLLGAR